ncbi:MAG: peptidase [Actinomycetia bacterium]|nr:peptidase [Actinomycetes bacterium]
MYNNPSAGAGVAAGGTGVLAYTGGSSIWLMAGAAFTLLLLGLILAIVSRRRSEDMQPTANQPELVTAGVQGSGADQSPEKN